MIKTLNLTQDHLKLIPFFFIQEDDDENIKIEKDHMFNLGSHLLEDISMVLGLQDKAIKGTENDPNGRAFDDKTEEYMLEVFNYIKDNLYYIESLIHQYAIDGEIGRASCRERV